MPTISLTVEVPWPKGKLTLSRLAAWAAATARPNMRRRPTPSRP